MDDLKGLVSFLRFHSKTGEKNLKDIEAIKNGAKPSGTKRPLWIKKGPKVSDEKVLNHIKKNWNTILPNDNSVTVLCNLESEDGWPETLAEPEASLKMTPLQETGVLFNSFS